MIVTSCKNGILFYTTRSQSLSGEYNIVCCLFFFLSCVKTYCGMPPLTVLLVTEAVFSVSVHHELV